MDHIPLVDMSGFQGGDADVRASIVSAIGRACETVGFLFVSGHGVPMQAIADLRSATVGLFGLPDARKRRLIAMDGAYSGYIPMASLSANAGTIDQPDLYEGYKLHAEQTGAGGLVTIVPDNIWPEEPAAFRAAVTTYWRHMDRLSDSLLRAFALSLGIAEQTFLKRFTDPMTSMTLLHYPPMQAASSGFGIHPHKDSDAFTILYPDPVGGLEVQPIGGDWIVADCPKGAFVVNIGNMMEMWSGGRFRSTPHKVVNRSGRERYSFPYFAVPNETVEIKPLADPVAGFRAAPLHVGAFMSEIYRTNRSDQKPESRMVDLGTLAP